MKWHDSVEQRWAIHDPRKMLWVLIQQSFLELHLLRVWPPLVMNFFTTMIPNVEAAWAERRLRPSPNLSLLLFDLRTNLRPRSHVPLTLFWLASVQQDLLILSRGDRDVPPRSLVVALASHPFHGMVHCPCELLPVSRTPWPGRWASFQMRQRSWCCNGRKCLRYRRGMELGRLRSRWRCLKP